MNQVYFYGAFLRHRKGLCRGSLNPFMNQVYFYTVIDFGKELRAACLNPFMNQVYFYTLATATLPAPTPQSLNPFMNQVYFYP